MRESGGKEGVVMSFGDRSRRVTRQNLRLKREIGLRCSLISPHCARQLTMIHYLRRRVQPTIDDLIVSVAIPASLGVRRANASRIMFVEESLGELPAARK